MKFIAGSDDEVSAQLPKQPPVTTQKTKDPGTVEVHRQGESSKRSDEKRQEAAQPDIAHGQGDDRDGRRREDDRRREDSRRNDSRGEGWRRDDRPQYDRRGAASKGEKRKLLWGEQKERETLPAANSQMWAESATQLDASKQNKFLRLMGCGKKASAQAAPTAEKKESGVSQDKLFSDLESSFVQGKKRHPQSRGGLGLGW